MVSVNLIFHIVSAITFVTLIWYLLHLQAQVAFLRELANSLGSRQAKLKVDWPEGFVKRFAGAYGIRFAALTDAAGPQPKAQALPPLRIDVRLWAELHQALELESIEWSGTRCRLKVKRDIELEAWRMRLETSLQGKITFEWSTSSASSKGL